MTWDLFYVPSRAPSNLRKLRTFSPILHLAAAIGSGGGLRAAQRAWDCPSASILLTFEIADLPKVIILVFMRIISKASLVLAFTILIVRLPDVVAADTLPDGFYRYPTIGGGVKSATSIFTI